MTADGLLQKLQDAARAEGIEHDNALAMKLGITQPMLTHIRVGRHKPGLKVLGGIIRNWPELEPAVLEYIRDAR